ncbi:MAG: family 43 glycosylhydrolase [Oscillospiraceae bacterium]|nr:family 43 glycosylhydrolase [Oscillospiraceae bacterium]
MIKKWTIRISAVDFMIDVQYNDYNNDSEVLNMAIEKLNDKPFKLEATANPISPNIFCADPTSVEYEGRLYVYGTNDHQQYEAVGDEGKNDYVHIKSLVIFSTEDMVNWEYHGIINTAETAPWITNSWAPSIVSRKEEDGLTHFYLYFSNNGNGVGVLTAVDPLGPWSDPLGKPLIYQNMPGLENCPAPFDPGVCIDDNGTGWLAFGGGTPSDGKTIYTKTAKIVKLGKNMLSFNSSFVSIDAPYFYEASELNYENGTYIYTYSTDWQSRDNWDRTDIPAPSVCSMGCMTSKTPLDADSWEFRCGLFLNAGESGMEWCNNHTHLMEYKGTRYILHHTMHIQERMNTNGGFRCMCVDYLPYSDKDFPVTKATREGVDQVQSLDPFKWHSGAEMFTCAAMGYIRNGEKAMSAESHENGSWIFIKGADFGNGAKKLSVKASGTGIIELRLDKRDNAPSAVIELTDGRGEYTVDSDNLITGDHNIYFAFSEKGICFEKWQFI